MLKTLRFIFRHFWLLLMLATIPVFYVMAHAPDGALRNPLQVSMSKITATPGPCDISSISFRGFDDRVYDAIMAHRKSKGLPEQNRIGRLDNAAARHAENMNEIIISHVGEDGSQVWDRVSRAGYRWTRVSENIYTGPIGFPPEGIVQGWYLSEGHRENLHGDYPDIGIAFDIRYLTGGPSNGYFLMIVVVVYAER